MLYPFGMAALCLACIASAQTPADPAPDRRVTGTVTWMGKPIRDARVRIPEARLETLTDSLGRFSFGAVPVALRDASMRPGSGTPIANGLDVHPMSAFVNPLGRTLGPPPAATGPIPMTVSLATGALLAAGWDARVRPDQREGREPGLEPRELRRRDVLRVRVGARRWQPLAAGVEHEHFERAAPARGAPGRSR